MPEAFEAVPITFLHVVHEIVPGSPAHEVLTRCGWLQRDWNRGRWITPFDRQWWWSWRARIGSWPYIFGQAVLICWVQEGGYWHEGHWVWPWEWMRRFDALCAEAERRNQRWLAKAYRESFEENGWTW